MDNQGANIQDLENRFYDILSEFTQGTTRSRSTRSHTPSSDYEIISLLLREYSSTMRDYNTNIRQIIRLISAHQTTRASATTGTGTRRQSTYVPQTPLFYYNYTTNWNPIPPPASNPNVLTREEIARATITYGFTENMIIYDNETGEPTNVCPISLDPFVIGDVVCEIRGCRHKFKRPNLMTWLRRNTRCPVCRFDLANTEDVQDASGDPVQDVSGAEQEEQVAPDTTESNVNNLQSTITQILQGFLNGSGSNLDISGNRLLYEFEIPMNRLFNNPDGPEMPDGPETPDVD